MNASHVDEMVVLFSVDEAILWSAVDANPPNKCRLTAHVLLAQRQCDWKLELLMGSVNT